MTQKPAWVVVYCITVERVDHESGRTITKWDYDMEKCSFCGLCVDACPTKTLSMSYDEIELGERKREFKLDKTAMLRKVNEAD